MASRRPHTSVETDGKLAEVLVTAQKREENLQSVPISVLVVGAQTLAEQNHTGLEDLTQTLPGVSIVDRGASNLITIRGIGSGENQAFDQSAAMFTDDIFHGRSHTSLAAFLDLDHLEVLKGPQSTFFGNNAIAGAINMVTKKPGDVLDADGRLLYGQFGQYAIEGAIGGPISEILGMRLALTRNGVNDGWIYNENTDLHVPIINNLGGRFTVRLHPGDLDATLKIEASRHVTTGTAFEFPEQMTNCPPPLPLQPYYNWIVGSNVCITALARGYPVGIESNAVAQLPGQEDSLSTFEDVLNLNYRHWGHTLTSVTGFYNYHYRSFGDATQLPLPEESVAEISEPEKYHQISQEFRIASSSDQPVEYMAGAYYQSDQLDLGETLNLPLFNGLGPSLSVPDAYLPLAQYLPFSQSERVYSAFGSVKWKITNDLSFNAGFRYSRVKKTATMSRDYGTTTGTYCCFTSIPTTYSDAWGSALGQQYTYSFDRADNGAMPSAGIQYQLNPDAMLYFAYSKGFKAGGFTNNYGTIGTFSYNPEHVNSFEAGIKSKWLDDTVMVNLDVFQMRYSDLQLTSNSKNQQTGTLSSYVANAAEAISQGVELETQWAVTSRFRLSSDVTYLHAYFSDYSNAPFTGSDLQNYCSGLSQADFAATSGCATHYPYPVPTTLNLTGQPTPFSARWSGNVKATYNVPLPHDYRLVTEASSYFTTSSNHQDPDLPTLYNNGYARLDARLSLETDDGRWALDVIGKNLTDHTIIVFPTLGFQSKQRPRNVVAQIRFHW